MKLSQVIAIFRVASLAYGLGVVLVMLYQVGGLRGLASSSIDRLQLVGYLVMLALAIVLVSAATVAEWILKRIDSK